MDDIEMKWIDLPSLVSIKMGDLALVGKDDESCSLTMRSIHSIDFQLIWIDLPNLASITSDGYSFYNPRTVIMESIEMKWEWFDNRYS